MGILGVVAATEARFRQRERERDSNLTRIANGEILQIPANTPELVNKRLRRLHADPERVQALTTEGLRFDPQGPGRSPQGFPRALERVLDTNDLMGMRFFEQGLRAARSVARVHIRGERGEALGYGTGFLVSPRLLLTNQHVLPSPAHARRSLVEFNYQESATGEIRASKVFPLAPEEFFLSDTELDYSLVALAPHPGLAAYGWLPLIADTGKLLVGESVNIIQHPNGEPKQLAIRHNQVVDELELFLHYQTDTDPGSSGAPVFNDQWEVVALHHSGVPKRNGQGEVLTSDGRLWQEWMGEQHIAWVANEGVRVSRLVRHIRERPLPPEGEALRDQLLEALPPPEEPLADLEDTRPLPGEVWLPEEPPSLAGPAPLAPSSGVVDLPPLSSGATWTIPLRLSISFGAPVPEPPGASPAPLPEEDDTAQERMALFGRRPPRPPAPAPAPPVSAADFRLDALASDRFDWQASLSLCLASELAYSPAAVVNARARAWGFSDSAFVENGPAQGFLTWTSEVAMVAFRGTESTADWLSNLRLSTRELTGFGRVHAGFLQQFEALRPELERLLNLQPDLPLQVTGHSLGGAIAVLAASSWAATRPVRGLYTFGQPAVAADSSTAMAMAARLPGRWHRLVNDADIVPRVPPTYRHAGHLLRFDSKGRVSSSRAGAAEAAPDRRGASPLPGAEAASRSPDPLADDSMLTPEDFRALQGQLQAGVATRGLEGSRGLISDHLLPGYLTRIRQQIG
jgi:V8-like Glu-specific endopeptidase